MTDAAGNYSFANLPPGAYRVREQVQAGWVQTSANPNDIVIQSGLDVAGVDFANFRLITISGQKFHDPDGDGVRDPGDPGLAGWTIELDLNSNGSVDRTIVTDAAGNYGFTDVGPGMHRIGELLKPGFSQTLPAAPGTYTIAATSGVDVPARDFANDSVGPKVEGVQLIYAGATRTTFSAIRLRYSEAVDSAKAQDLSNYRLRTARTRPTDIALARAELGPDPQTVTLHLAKPVKVAAHELTVRDSLTDRSGLALDGNNDGIPGGAYTALLGNKLALREADGDTASLALKNGVLVLRNGRHLQLLDTAAGSVLAGSVKPARAGSDGVVHLDAITGLGGVQNNLPLCSATKQRTCFQIDSPSTVALASFVPVARRAIHSGTIGRVSAASVDDLMERRDFLGDLRLEWLVDSVLEG